MEELHSNFYERLKLTCCIAYQSQRYKGEGRIIAILDSGIRVTHNEFNQQQIVLGKNFAESSFNGVKYDENDISDDSFGGHGTQIASLLIGRTLGIIPNAKY